VSATDAPPGAPRRPVDPDAAGADAPPPAARAFEAAHVRQLRLGTGANCSSIGSVVDTLFATAAVGAALFAGVVAALRSEPVRVAGAAKDEDRAPAGRADGGEEREA
jgi:hypothetical protein